MIRAGERARRQAEQYTVEQIRSMLDATWDAIAADAGEMPATDVVDFLVSNQGMYSDGLDLEKWERTDRETINEATTRFARDFGMEV